MVGIVGYGGYVPRFRIKTEEIAAVWNEDGERIKSGLLINEKSVPDIDEDTVTISVAAAKNALRCAQLSPKRMGALYVGSESHPYAVKSSAAIVAEAIGTTPYVMAASLEFACKAGTAGIQMCMGLVASGMIEYGMAIGADTAQGRPNDALEYSAAAGGAAFIIGKKDVLVEINDTLTYTTDTPDFWRRQGEEFPQHGGRFTGEPAYFRHTTNAVKALMEKVKSKAGDYDYFVPHQPNGKFPLKLANGLGIEKDKVKPSLLVTQIGNTYSGASPLGLVKVLDDAKPGDRILMVSYGSGSGADAFDMTVTDAIKGAQKRSVRLDDCLKDKEYVSYGVYSKLRRKLKGI
ncbi:MAG: hydroxymethylglutaryl-CoA synthase [Candidatus Altiarchaeota archaeon]|nr:hydroxymethylglutaryl-CoA synthase [Candidatus Altiarchaeota archaeon]